MLNSRALNDDEKQRIYDWALARERARYPEVTIVVADHTDYDGRARYSIVSTASSTVSRDEVGIELDRRSTSDPQE